MDTPLHVHLGWWASWRDMIRHIKKDPKNIGYQTAAQLAQAYYVMFSAQYFAGVK